MFELLNKAEKFEISKIYAKVVRAGLMRDECDRCKQETRTGFVRGKGYQVRNLNGTRHGCPRSTD